MRPRGLETPAMRGCGTCRLVRRFHTWIIRMASVKDSALSTTGQADRQSRFISDAGIPRGGISP